MRTQDYYDEFSAGYERERGRGYHQVVDDLEVDLVERYGRGAHVLEAGCGTGLILERVQRFAATARGFDLSSGMLAKARARKLDVTQASVTDIPFSAESFDVVYSFKVLAHVERIQSALAEIARVTKRGGYMLLEFYNPTSLRGLVKAWKRPTAISATANDHDVYTRYDALDTIKTYLPAGCHIATMRGVRVVTPTAQVYKIAPLGRMFTSIERALADAPIFRRLGGFLIVVAQKA